jgi:F-type H+-transporting ATPase subunit a
MHSPLEQFEIKELVPLSISEVPISFTNSALYMFLSVVAVSLLFWVGTRKKDFIPGKMQSFTEIIFGFINALVDENIGPKGMPFLPLIFSLFTFILFGNLFGMLPYAYTFTSQIILTFGLAMLVFIIITLLGFIKHGFGFFSYFLPKGTPLLMVPLLFIIELISFLSRPVSLSIRLFANMMAGHTMLKVFSMFTISLGIFGFSTIIASIILIGFEFMVAFLQAYVFSVLTCLYIRDAIELH